MSNQTNTPTEPRIAVAIPCYNEETTVAKVVRDFHESLPQARIYVFDNASADRTAEAAREAGATVHYVPQKGKGAVVASILSNVDADYYLLADGDDTYPAENAMDLLTPLIEGRADMTVGQRLTQFTNDSFRPLHVFGNKFFSGMLNRVFNTSLTDVLSGYRGFTRRLADAMPAISTGFDVESEMTLISLGKGFVLQEIPVSYRERPSGSVSKLSTFRDGFVILFRILRILVTFKPRKFFTFLSLIMFVLSAAFGYFPVVEYFTTHYVDSVPKFILSVGLATTGVLFFCIGLMLSIINHRFENLENVMTRNLHHIHKSLAEPTRTPPPGSSS